MKIISWNINGVKTKLEKKVVQKMLLNFDIICLNEVRTSLTISFPGYVGYKSSVHGPSHRGGTIIFLKNPIVRTVINADTSIDGQVWLRFSFEPKTMFGFCYVPPFESQYFSHTSFVSIQEKLKCEYLVDKFVLLGDMNARFGHFVREIVNFMELSDQ